jgi:hypothetical protein
VSAPRSTMTFADTDLPRHFLAGASATSLERSIGTQSRPIRRLSSWQVECRLQCRYASHERPSGPARRA